MLTRGGFHSPHYVTIQVWTEHLADDIIWGGATYSLRPGVSTLEVVIFPLLQSQQSCAEMAMSGWSKRKGWDQRKETVFRFVSTHTDDEVQISNPFVLQHLARLQGMITSTTFYESGPKKWLCSTLENRLEGLIKAGNTELAGTLRLPV